MRKRRNTQCHNEFHNFHNFQRQFDKKSIFAGEGVQQSSHLNDQNDKIHLNKKLCAVKCAWKCFTIAVVLLPVVCLSGLSLFQPIAFILLAATIFDCRRNKSKCSFQSLIKWMCVCVCARAYESHLMDLELCWFEMMWYATVSNCIYICIYVFLWAITCSANALCRTIILLLSFSLSLFFGFDFNWMYMCVHVEIIRFLLFLSTWSNIFWNSERMTINTVVGWWNNKHVRKKWREGEREWHLHVPNILFASKALKFSLLNFPKGKQIFRMANECT